MRSTRPLLTVGYLVTSLRSFLNKVTQFGLMMEPGWFQTSFTVAIPKHGVVEGQRALLLLRGLFFLPNMQAVL